MVAQNEFTKVLIHKRGTNLFFSGRHCFFRLISAMAVQNEFWESSMTCTNGHASLLSITYKIVFGSLMSVQIVATYGSVPESGVGSTFKNISNYNLYKSPHALSCTAPLTPPAKTILQHFIGSRESNQLRRCNSLPPPRAESIWERRPLVSAKFNYNKTLSEVPDSLEDASAFANPLVCE